MNEKKEPRQLMEIIFQQMAEKTIRRLEKEKAAKISRKTVKMVAMTKNLFDSLPFGR